MFRVLVCGARDWDDGGMVRRELALLLGSHRAESVVVIEGEARGADTWARQAAVSLGMQVLSFPADWERHHRAAGPIRNQKMLVEGRPDAVWAFHDDLESSKGTKDMVARAAKVGVPVTVFSHQSLLEEVDI